MTIATKVAIRNIKLYIALFWFWFIEDYLERKIRQALCNHERSDSRRKDKCRKCGKKI